MKFIKLFENHSGYEDFVSGDTMVKPNVSHCVQENEVHYNQLIPPLKLVATFNMENSGMMCIVGFVAQDEDNWDMYADSFSEIEVDGIKINKSDLSGTGGIRTSAGNHTVIYTLVSSEIGYRSFFDCSDLTSIVIPNGVTSIGGRAFDYCSSLTSVTIPNSVTSIGNDAFCGTNLDAATQAQITAINENGICEGQQFQPVQPLT